MKYWYALAAILASVIAFNASAQTSSTQRPQPTKPNFAPLQFLIGRWACSRTLSGRPPITTTDRVHLDQDGYWLIETETVASRPSFPYTVIYTDRITYDAVAQRWVDLASSNFGHYTVDTSKGFVGRTWVWHHELYAKSADTASMTDFVLTKVNDSKTTATISLILNSGKIRMGTRTCKKLR